MNANNLYTSLIQLEYNRTAFNETFEWNKYPFVWSGIWKNIWKNSSDLTCNIIQMQSQTLTVLKRTWHLNPISNSPQNTALIHSHKQCRTNDNTPYKGIRCRSWCHFAHGTVELSNASCRSKRSDEIRIEWWNDTEIE